MRRTAAILIVTVEVIAISVTLKFSHFANDKVASKEESYQERVSRMLTKGPLVNTTPYQYSADSIFVPKAHAEEPRLEKLSVEKASAYLELGNESWNNTAKCVTCHTNGSYMAYRPALTPQLGRPSEKAREFFERTLRDQLATPKKDLDSPTQVIYVASGLAQWDAHVKKSLTRETRQALELMFDLQEQSGSWKAPGNCWPPFESDSYQAATMSAMAVAAAPGWMANLGEVKLLDGVKRLKSYLRRERPPHDYGRVFLLWGCFENAGPSDKGRARQTDRCYLDPQTTGRWLVDPHICETRGLGIRKPGK